MKLYLGRAWLLSSLLLCAISSFHGVSWLITIKIKLILTKINKFGDDDVDARHAEHVQPQPFPPEKVSPLF